MTRKARPARGTGSSKRNLKSRFSSGKGKIKKANGHGGKRAHAGRKASVLLAAKRALVQVKAAEAEFAFSLLCAYMHARPKKGQPETLALMEFKKSCAVQVMDQVWGKPMPRAPEGAKTVLLVVPNDGDA